MEDPMAPHDVRTIECPMADDTLEIIVEAAIDRLERGRGESALPSDSPLFKFLRDDEGQPLVEYVFVAVFIALVVFVCIQAIGWGLNTQRSSIGTQLSSGS
jgi:Flp pilus assembly pilin Flp